MWAFRCARTRLYYPEDYVEQWGRRYNNSAGLGPVPVSEALVNRYDLSISGKNAESTMHPLEVCRAQVDLVDISEEEYYANQAIVDIDDPLYTRRAQVMRDKQLAKSSVLASMFPAEVEPARARIIARRETAIAAYRASVPVATITDASAAEDVGSGTRSMSRAKRL
jgi:hypothetical protein